MTQKKTPEERRMQKLGQLMSIMLDEGLTKEDFVNSFENVVKYVKKFEEQTATDLGMVKDSLSALAEKVKSDASTTLEDLKAEARQTLAMETQKLARDLSMRMQSLQAQMDAVQDGKDADEEVIVGKVLSRIPPTPEVTPYDDGIVKGDIDILYTKTEDLEKAVKEAKDVRVVAPSRGMFLYIDGVKKGIISNLNLKGGTNMAIAYSQVNGQDTLTFNASGGGPGGLTVETPPEAPNAVITAFTVSAEPQWVVADGTTYFDGQGYTYAALQVTMDIPPSATIRVII